MSPITTDVPQADYQQVLASPVSAHEEGLRFLRGNPFVRDKYLELYDEVAQARQQDSTSLE